jgi:hypothetical protein
MTILRKVINGDLTLWTDDHDAIAAGIVLETKEARNIRCKSAIDEMNCRLEGQNAEMAGIRNADMATKPGPLNLRRSPSFAKEDAARIIPDIPTRWLDIKLRRYRWP